MAWFIRPILFCTDARWRIISTFISAAAMALGSALVPRAGDGVSPSRTFLNNYIAAQEQCAKKGLFRRDAKTSTRDKCATRNSNPPMARWALLAGACAIKL